MQFTVPLNDLIWFFKAASVVSYEIRVQLKDGVIGFSKTDPSNVFLMSAEVPVETSDTGEFSGMTDILKILQKLPKSADVIVDVDKENGVMKVSSGNYRVTVKLIVDGVVKTVNPPSIELNTVYTGDLADFRRAVDLCSKVSDLVCFVAKEETLTLKSEGDIDEITVELEGVSKGEATARYNVELLNEIVKHYTGEVISIKFDTDKPVWIESEHGGSKLISVIAPVLEGQY